MGVYVYGLEIIDVVAILVALAGQLSSRTATFYIVNSNSSGPIVRGYTETTVVDSPVRFFRSQIQSLGIWVRFELIPEGANPPGPPTRHVIGPPL